MKKIAVVGAGSYVFSMGLLYDLIMEQSMGKTQLVLMDVNEDIVHLMAAIAKQMIKDADSSIVVEATTDRSEALRGAHFVTTSVAIGLQRRYEMDLAVLANYGIQEVSSECGGVGGLAYSLRSIPLVLSIAKDMEKYCPNAWLLNVSNPLPRVLTAVTQHTKIRSLGFCNVAHGGMGGGYENIGRLIGRDPLELDVISAGLNHFSWLLSIQDKKTGEDLMPVINKAVSEGRWGYGSQSVKLWREYGYLPLAGDSHIGEFVPFDPQLSKFHRAHHGDEQVRLKRIQLMRDVVAGISSWRALLDGRAWEKPGLLIQALSSGQPLHLDMVNLANQGNIKNLPDGAVVEVPADAANETVTGAAIELPEPLVPLLSRVSQVHTLVAQAAVSGDRAMVEEVIATDPAITDKLAAIQAINELITTHADVLPQFV